MASKPLWLNLGCSDDLRPEYVNVDRTTKYPCPVPFQACNLENHWPWRDSCVDFILARDIFEHLHDKVFTMNEAWRVLKPGGMMQIEVPTTDGRGAFQDPTHVSFWNINSFFYYEHGNAHRERFGDSYGVKARFEIVKQKHEKLIDEVMKLTIILKAVKPDADKHSSPMG
jgi:SAM-dependent methyltransferase